MRKVSPDSDEKRKRSSRVAFDEATNSENEDKRPGLGRASPNLASIALGSRRRRSSRISGASNDLQNVGGTTTNSEGNLPSPPTSSAFQDDHGWVSRSNEGVMKAEEEFSVERRDVPLSTLDVKCENRGEEEEEEEEEDIEDDEVSEDDEDDDQQPNDPRLDWLHSRQIPFEYSYLSIPGWIIRLIFIFVRFKKSSWTALVGAQLMLELFFLLFKFLACRWRYTQQPRHRKSKVLIACWFLAGGAIEVCSLIVAKVPETSWRYLCTYCSIFPFGRALLCFSVFTTMNFFGYEASYDGILDAMLDLCGFIKKWCHR